VNNNHDGQAIPFGGADAPEGTTYFTIDLTRETEEYGRQLVVYPKAHHPQMESLVALKSDASKPVFSLAACGFNQLALMDDVPLDVAEEYDVPKWGFRSSAVVNVSSQILGGWENNKPPVFTDGAVEQLQQFLILYAQAVWRIQSPLVMMINPVAAEENEWHGIPWFTFTVAFVMGVDQEEWDKLYSLKRQEMIWATKVRDVAVLRAKISTALAINKSKNTH